MKKGLFIFLLHSLTWLGFAQQQKQLRYPLGYFQFPINPNHQNYLAGGMGDLRPNHFHAGIDIKTQGREGLPIHCAADGYVSEVRVQTKGYGNVIFVTHPNGFVTVYGHLQSFGEPLGAYVRKNRITQQTFTITLKPEVNQFPVKRGDIIGISGNTGGSGGPHLHFEIRDIKNNILNPLNFGFSEIKDNLPPIFQSLLIKPLSISSRVSNDFAMKTYYPVRQKDGTYSLGGNVNAIGDIGLELLAVDKMSGTQNSNGLTCVELLVDGQEQYYANLEQFPSEVSHDINVHNDFGLEQLQGKRVQKLFQDDGNDDLPIYRPSRSKGKLHIADGKTHQISIRIWDAYENNATLNFTINGKNEPAQNTVKISAAPLAIRYEIAENTLILKAQHLKTPTSVATLVVDDKPIVVPINFSKQNTAIYLWDLRKGLPQSINIDGITRPFSFLKTFYPSQNNEVKTPNLQLIAGTRAVYDTLYLTGLSSGNNFTIGQADIPLRREVNITFTPNENILVPNKTSVYRILRSDREFLASRWQNNSVLFSTEKLGNFTLLTDSIPPRMTLVKKNKDGFSFKVFDNLSGLKRVKATVNGQYVLMDYDYKRNLIWSLKENESQIFEGQLSVEVEDYQGNSFTYQSIIDKVEAVINPPKKTEKPKKKHIKKK